MFEQKVTLGPGTGTFTSHTLEILIMLLGAFLLGLWLGWVLWNRYKQQVDKLVLENQSNVASLAALRAELDDTKAKYKTSEDNYHHQNGLYNELQISNASLSDRLALLEKQLADVEARNRQLETELGLSAVAPDRVAHDLPLEIVDVPFEMPALILPEPTLEEPVIEEPAVESAPDNSFDLHIGTEVIEPESLSSADAADVHTPIVAALAADPDDLTIIEGIGPKIAMLLNQYGIHTYRELANTDVARLKEILQSAGPQLAMHNPGTWPSQSNLAANGEWDTLKSLQEFLKGGKAPK